MKPSKRIAQAGRPDRMAEFPVLARQGDARFRPLDGRRAMCRWMGLVMVLGVWAVPNNEAAWWHDRLYDGCMLVLDDDRDWECETRLPAMDG